MRKVKKVIAFFIMMVFVLTGCTATTNIRAKQQGVSLKITDKSYATLPTSGEFGVTTFGNYEFVAERDGYEPLYGVLPLKFNGGYLALNILFFTPACFFNLREVYPYYDIDMDRKVIRCSKDNINWYDEQILPEDSEQSEKYFKVAQTRPVDMTKVQVVQEATTQDVTSQRPPINSVSVEQSSNY